MASNPVIPQFTPEEIKKIEEETKEAIDHTNLLLSSAIHTLLRSHAFVGHLIQMLNRRMSVDIPTAAVCAIDSRYFLLVNPFFYSSLSSDEAKAVATHEVYHLLNDHLTRGKSLDPHLWNVAADMAINCYIANLPRFDKAAMKEKLIKQHGMTEEEAEKQLPKADKDGKCCSCLLPQDYGLPEKRTAEFYYKSITENKDLLKKFQRKTVYINPETGETNLTPEEQEQLKEDIKSGKVRFDFGAGSHDEWDSVQGNTQGILDEELKRMIREAKEKAPESFGNLPGNMQEEILKFLTTEINWKQRLRSFMERATEIFRINTRKRRSRRFGITYQGQKTDPRLKLGIYVDSSGSISEADLKLFGGEINRIWNTKLAKIEIMVGDTQTHEHYKMKKKMLPKDFKVSGRGGTDASEWIKYANKHDFDALVILTDGWFSFNLPKPKYGVMWVLTQNGYAEKDFANAVKFGKIVKIKKEEK